MAGKGKGFRIFSNILMIVLSLACILPFVLLLSSSVTSDDTILKYGYSFLPRDVDFAAYRFLFMGSTKIIKAYGLTILVTAVGMTTNIFLTMMLGYLLSRKDLPGRAFFSFFIFFTMLFSGGMIPSYIVWSRFMKVSDTLFGLICPNLLLSAFNVILMRTDLTAFSGAMNCRGRMFFSVLLSDRKPKLRTSPAWESITKGPAAGHQKGTLPSASTIPGNFPHGIFSVR